MCHAMGGKPVMLSLMRGGAPPWMKSLRARGGAADFFTTGDTDASPFRIVRTLDGEIPSFLRAGSSVSPQESATVHLPQDSSCDNITVEH
jgi:hypothetical protein